MKKLTLKDIAGHLNISVSTVSKSLSDSYEISAATKKMVNAYVEKHHYVPNRLAKTLKTGKTNTVGVIVSDITNAFIAQVLDGIQRCSQREKYDIIIMQSGTDADREAQAIDVLRMRGIDGLLISPVTHSSSLQQLEDLQLRGIPVVLFDRIDHGLRTHKVGIDNQKSAYEATHHLIRTGKSRILHITARDIGVAADRLSGYKKCLNDVKIAFDPYLYLQCARNQQEDIEQAIRVKLLALREMNKMPDAIFGATDNVTVVSLSVLASLNIRVPEEISVVGFSNISMPKAFNPALSTIVQPASEMGEIALKQLLHFIHAKAALDEFETVQLDACLIPRRSSIAGWTGMA